jgi:hypothetical protein
MFLFLLVIDSIITKSCYHEKSVLTAPCIPAIAAIKKDFSTIHKLWPSIIINPDIICIEKIVLIDDLLSFKQKYALFFYFSFVRVFVLSIILFPTSGHSFLYCY